MAVAGEGGRILHSPAHPLRNRQRRRRLQTAAPTPPTNFLQKKKKRISVSKWRRIGVFFLSFFLSFPSALFFLFSLLRISWRVSFRRRRKRRNIMADMNQIAAAIELTPVRFYLIFFFYPKAPYACRDSFHIIYTHTRTHTYTHTHTHTHTHTSKHNNNIINFHLTPSFQKVDPYLY